MRIAYLINQYPTVSHTFIRREILALERQGYDILRIALRGWDSDLVDPADQAELKRTQYVLRAGALALLLAVGRMLLARPAHFVRALKLALRMSRNAERPLPIHLVYFAEACLIESWLRASDVTHLHAHFGTNSAEVAMLVHVLGGPPWSFTVHGPEEFDKAPLIGLAEKIRRCAFVVAVSSYGRSQLYRLVEQQLWPKVHLVRCGLDRAFFDAPETPPPTGRRFVCVGRLCEQKGHLLLIEAVHQLVADGADCELVLAGDGELRGEIHRLVAYYKLQGKVRIAGWISGEQVRNEVLNSRALVLPSFAEGLPVVLMEAMALRRPVISTYVAGVPELVRPGKNGWLVPAGDVGALVDAMRTCLDMPTDLLLGLGKAAHNCVQAQHVADTEAAKLAKLFRQVIGQ